MKTYFRALEHSHDWSSQGRRHLDGQIDELPESV